MGQYKSQSEHDQIIKRSKQGGRLQLGTEVVASGDGSLAALLGASPGASTAVSIMLEVLQRCFKQRLDSEAWQQRLQALLPSIHEHNADVRLGRLPVLRCCFVELGNVFSGNNHPLVCAPGIVYQ